MGRGAQVVLEETGPVCGDLARPPYALPRARKLPSRGKLFPSQRRQYEYRPSGERNKNFDFDTAVAALGNSFGNYSFMLLCYKERS